MRRVGQVVSGVAGVALWLAASPAFAQSNLDAGKSAAQIFSHTCNACHRSPREIKRTTVGFMREHYTTGIQEAQTMTAYLLSVGTDPKAVEQRRKPVLGAGTAPVEAPSRGDQAKGDAGKADDAQAKGTQHARVRRPSESLEIDQSVADTAPAAPPAAVTAVSPPVTPASAFEE